MVALRGGAVSYERGTPVEWELEFQPRTPIAGRARLQPVSSGSDFTKMCSGSEAGSYLRLTDSCITQLKAKDLLGPVTRLKKKKSGSGKSKIEQFYSFLLVSSSTFATRVNFRGQKTRSFSGEIGTRDKSRTTPDPRGVSWYRTTSPTRNRPPP